MFCNCPSAPPQAIVATGTPVVVVLIHGGPLAIEWTKANVPAIVSAHYPGELGGEVGGDCGI